MDIDDILTIIKDFNLFMGLEEEVLNQIAKKCEIEVFPKNKNIITQGDVSNKIYFILDGDAEIYILDQEGNETKVYELKKGDHFGELALFTKGIRRATVRTVEQMTCASLSKEHFDEISSLSKAISDNMNVVLSERFVRTLDLVSQKKHMVLTVLVCPESGSDKLGHFMRYFDDISSKSVTIIDGNFTEEWFSKEILHGNMAGNVIIQAKYDISEKILRHCDYCVNFLDKKPKQFFIAENATTWEIENVVRLINNKRIGIALSSGGAAGIAHLGVLKVLQDEGIPLDYIVGTSAGAFYGGCYAFGLSVDKIISAVLDRIHKPRWYEFLKNLNFSFSGLLKHDVYSDILKKLIGDQNIEDANIPFAAVASDLYTGQTVTIKKGNAISAITASNSAPVIVQPYKLDNRILIDGVATEPLPIHELLDEKIDIKIAVPISQIDLPKSVERLTIPSIFIRSRSIMAEKMESLSMTLADVIIRPETTNIGVNDWDQYFVIFDAGVQAARKAIKRINYLLKK